MNSNNVGKYVYVFVWGRGGCCVRLLSLLTPFNIIYIKRIAAVTDERI
jgi:hypothetical protein